MTIGIDVDDTITKTTETLNNIPGMTRELLYKIFNHPKSISNFEEKLDEVFSNMDIFDNVIDVIKEWKKLGYKVILITARGSQGMDALVQITDRFIKKNNIPVDGIIYRQEEKGTACKNNGVDVFIDDNEIVLDEVKSKGIKTIRFSKNDVVSNHLVLHNWLELKEYIARLGDNDGKNN